MMPLWAQLAILFAIGVAVGFINVLAGGGSLLSLPALIFFGLPGALANGTNRIAILIQNLVAIAGFQRHNVFPWRVGTLAAIPALLGTFLGATVAVDLPDRLFKRLLAAIMVVVLLIIFLDPAKRIAPTSGELTRGRKIFLAVAFFLVGVYGGFIQAGVGFLIITAMLLGGFDMVQTNAVKVFVVFIFTIAALWIFIAHGQVNMVLGLGLGAGNAVGGYFGTHIAVKKSHRWVKGFVSVMVVIFAAKLLYDSLDGG